jgi:hypothetical protein
MQKLLVGQVGGGKSHSLCAHGGFCQVLRSSQGLAAATAMQYKFPIYRFAALHLLFHGVVGHPGAHDVPDDVPRRIRLHAQRVRMCAGHPVACGQVHMHFSPTHRNWSACLDLVLTLIPQAATLLEHASKQEDILPEAAKSAR